MFKIGHLGTFPVLPELGMAIYAGDTAAVEALMQQGADIEEQLTLSRHSAVTPLDLALMTNQPEVVRVLVAHGANLNAKDSPAILTAARYSSPDILRYLHQEGAKLNAVNRVKSNVYDEAYYGKKANLPILQELGLDIRKHAGRVLRKAVSDHDLRTIRYLLEEGVDINYNAADMVCPYQATPLTVAARSNRGSVFASAYCLEPQQKSDRLRRY